MLAVVLIYLIMGQQSGVFVSGVADNIVKFAGAIPAPSLAGLAVVSTLIFLISNRMRSR